MKKYIFVLLKLNNNNICKIILVNKNFFKKITLFIIILII